MLSGVMLGVAFFIVMLSVAMLTVVMLGVMRSVVVPSKFKKSNIFSKNVSHKLELTLIGPPFQKFQLQLTKKKVL
jgi:hypothetical protein